MVAIGIIAVSMLGIVSSIAIITVASVKSNKNKGDK